MSAFSVEELIDLCIAHRKEEARGEKGVTTVILIEDQPRVFMELFVLMKREGYTRDDFLTSHRKRIANACLPKHKKGIDKAEWDANTFLTLLKAEAAVFDTPYSEGHIPSIDPKELEFYHDRFEQIGKYFNDKYLKQKEKHETSKQKYSVSKTEKYKQNVVSDFDESEDFGMGDDEAFIPHPEAKSVDPEVFKVPHPETIEDDFSWLPKGEN